MHSSLLRIAHWCNNCAGHPPPGLWLAFVGWRCALGCVGWPLPSLLPWPALNSHCYASCDLLSCLSFNQLSEEGACSAVGFWFGCCGWGAGWLVVLGAAASSGSLAEGTMLFFGLLHDLPDWTKGHLTVLSSAIARCGSTGAGRLGSLSVCCVCGLRWFGAVLGLVWRVFALALPSPPAACS